LTSLRIGTRGSDLAIWQANDVFKRISELPGAPPLEIVEIKSSGDLNQSIPLWTTTGRGFFTVELDQALIDEKIDLAVHSLKDLATVVSEGTLLAAVLEREDPRDAIVTRDGEDLMGLAKGARLGTSSLRRRAFVANARPDIEHAELRGNVPTRLRKLDDGEYDAIILATAGLKRLGLGDRISARLPTDIFPPAAAQGAVAICTRAGDEEALRWARPLEHKATRLAVDAERSLLRRLEGGCQAPVGTLATISDDSIGIFAAVCSLDGTDFVSARTSGSTENTAKIGAQLAEELLKNGAGRALKEADERRKAAAR
jgi:hydroxymethylbilane synthase